MKGTGTAVGVPVPERAVLQWLLQLGVLTAGEQTGVLLVGPKNVYGYGPAGGPVGETWHLPGPQAVTTRRIPGLAAAAIATRRRVPNRGPNLEVMNA